MSDPILDTLGETPQDSHAAGISAVLFEIIVSGNALVDLIDASAQQRLRRRSDRPRLEAAKQRWRDAKDAFADILEQEAEAEQ